MEVERLILNRITYPVQKYTKKQAVLRPVCTLWVGLGWFLDLPFDEGF
jgi:hypothetical protein